MGVGCVGDRQVAVRGRARHDETSAGCLSVRGDKIVKMPKMQELAESIYLSIYYVRSRPTPRSILILRPANRGCPRPRVVPARLPMPSRHHRDRCARSRPAMHPCPPRLPRRSAARTSGLWSCSGATRVICRSGEKGWRVRSLFAHHEGSQPRTGGREHATTRASRLKKRVKKTMPPYGVYGVGSGVAI